MSRLRTATSALGAVLTVLALASCSSENSSAPGGGASSSESAAASGQRFPDVVEVSLSPAGGGSYDVSVTLESAYDTPERYADGWRVLAPDGTVLGEHTLLHDHAGEQPFTRTQPGVVIPDGVGEVIVEGRDLVNGFGGATVRAPVPR